MENKNGIGQNVNNQVEVEEIELKELDLEKVDFMDGIPVLTQIIEQTKESMLLIANEEKILGTKLRELFKLDACLKLSYDSLLNKYPKSKNKIDKLFIYVGIIKLSSLYSRDSICRKIMVYIDNLDIKGLSKYLGSLLVYGDEDYKKNEDGDGYRKGFPNEISRAFFKIEENLDFIIS